MNLDRQNIMTIKNMLIMCKISIFCKQFWESLYMLDVHSHKMYRVAKVIADYVVEIRMNQQSFSTNRLII